MTAFLLSGAQNNTEPPVSLSLYVYGVCPHFLPEGCIKLGE